MSPIKKNNNFLKIEIIKNTKKLRFTNILLLIIIAIFPSILSKQTKIKNMNLMNEITIIIKGTGTQRILEQNAVTPNQLYVNNYSVTVSKSIIISSEPNTVRMVWNSPLTSCNSMFYGLTNILQIDLSKFDSSEVTDMSDMFHQCTSLTSIDFNNMNTSKVTSFNYTFYQCENLKHLNLCSFDTSSATTMFQMFFGCKSLESLDLSNFNTSSVTLMFQMFYNCSELKDLNISSFNTKKVTNMFQMFFGCNSIKSLNLTNFDTSSLTEMAQMFLGCESLESLDLSSFDTSKITQMYDIFIGCKSLVRLDLSSFETSLVVNMGTMFKGCSSLIYLNLSSFDTSNVIFFDNMFNGCKSLEFLDISNFNTSSGNMTDYMFSDCQSLKALDISNFNTSKVKSMIGMFNNCYSLENLELGNFDTSSVTNMISMFYNCTSLKFLNLYSFNTNKVINIDGMFFNVELLFYCINDEINENIKAQLSSYIKANCTEVCYYNSKQKYILNKNKCINDCSNDEYYFYEYNNACYGSCPNGTHIINNTKCKDDLICENYYNYEYTNCLDYIPLGYYLNDTQKKTIDKCNIKCSNCTNNSVIINLCISCNNSAGYYAKFNNSLNNNEFIDCYNGEYIGYYLDIVENLYYPCYITCKTCNGNGDIFNNNCSECYTNYTLINGNCYEISDLEPSTTNNIYDSSSNILVTDISDEYSYTILDSDYITFRDYDLDSISNLTTINVNSEDYFITNNSSSITDDVDEKIKNQIINGELFSSFMKGEEKYYIIKEGNAIHSVMPLDNQEEDCEYNLTSVDLGVCEDVLREKYNLSHNDILLIYKREIFIDGLLIPIVDYEIYSNKYKNELNMGFCKDIKINLNIPVSINEENLFKYDPSSPYYNDLCYPYTSEYNTDIIISDRKKEFNNNNMSLCEFNCTYKGYKPETKTASCECEVKTEISVIDDIINNKDKLTRKFYDIKNTVANLELMKCYYTLFNKNGLISNIGSYILLFVIMIELILMIYYIVKGYYNYINYIKEKIINYEEKECKLNKPKEDNNDVNIEKECKLNKPKKDNNNVNIEYKNKLNIRGKKKRRSSKITKETQSNPPKNKITKIKNIKINLKNKTTKNIINTSENENIKKYPINNKILEKLEKEKNIFIYNDFELNNFSYEEALKLDKRLYSQYYISILKYNQQLIFTFYTSNDYNSKIIKISLFLFLFSSYYVVNTLFFNDEAIHIVYINKGVYNLIFQLPQIIYSSFISNIIKVIISYFSLTEKKIIKAKNKKENKVELFKCLLLQIRIFYIILFLFLILFWYYLACFCDVYKNFQINVIKDNLISFSLSQLYPIGICLLPGIFRIISLKDDKGGKEGLYQFSKLLQLL